MRPTERGSPASRSAMAAMPGDGPSAEVSPARAGRSRDPVAACAPDFGGRPATERAAARHQGIRDLGLPVICAVRARHHPTILPRPLPRCANANTGRPRPRRGWWPLTRDIGGRRHAPPSRSVAASRHRVLSGTACVPELERPRQEAAWSCSWPRATRVMCRS